MAKKITATGFYKIFIEALKDNEAETRKCYKNNVDWTNHMKRTIEMILRPKYETNDEYFRIDKIGWTASSHPDWGSTSSFKQAAPGLVNERCWDLDVAVEYENDPADWTDEVIKLCHIKCGLKVVIGYANYNDRESKDGKSDDDKLRLVAKCMRMLEYGQLGAEEEFLIILGNCGKKSYDNIDEDIRFIPYEYKNGSFQKLIVG